MVKVEDNQITQTSLPKHGYINGRFVSSMRRVPTQTLKDNGWYEPIHDYPAYDPTYQKLSSPTYTYDSETDTVVANYTVINRPEKMLQQQVDEQQGIIADLVEELFETQELMADLTEEVLLSE